MSQAALTKGGTTKKAALFQLVLLSHGVGILFGFCFFYSFYRTHCANLLSTTEEMHNRSVLVLQNQHASLSAAHSNDNNNNQESLTRQRLQLEQQTALAGKHQDLLQRHEETLNRLSKLQQQHDAQAEVVQALQEQVKQTAQQMEKTKQQTIKRQERLKTQLDLAKTMMQEKVDEVEELKSQLEDNDDSSNAGSSSGSSSDSNNDEAMVHLQAAIRRRSMALTMRAYGQGPTYTVLFLLTGPSLSGASSVEVEFDGTLDMPHTVHTFLTLVDAGLYHETTLTLRDANSAKGDRGGSQQELVLVGGSPATSVRKQVQSKLMRLYAETGLSSTSPFLFTERSSLPCGEYSVGFGSTTSPDFFIITEARDDDDSASTASQHTCPGRVVSGMDTLDSLTAGDRVTIVDARIVQSSGGSDSSSDEL